MAQVAHAANQMVWEARSINRHPEVQVWEEETPYGFGTTVVLNGVDEDTIRKAVTECYDAGYHSGIVIDPEYPLADGKVVHIIPDFLTCGYVFAPEGECSLLRRFNRHP